MKTKMKKCIIFLCVVAMFFVMALPALAEEKEVEVYVNDEKIVFDVNPVIENGRTLVPMRFIFEALGANVNWIDETQTAVASKDAIKIEISINSTEMLRNGEVIVLDVPAKLVDGRTLVPVRAVSEGLGATVDWNEELYRVIIATPTGSEQSSEKESSDDDSTGKTDAESGNKEYSYTELSEKDMELLKSQYADVRYVFEQQFVVQTLNDLAKEGVNWESTFNEKEPQSEMIINDIWDNMFYQLIVNIQLESDDMYIFKDIEEGSLISAYYGILKNGGIASDDVFKSEYVVTPGGKNVLLVTFYNTDTPLACKYIGVVAYGNGVRCFTAETDDMLKEMNANIYFFCEVKGDSRANLGQIGTTTQDFLAAIDNIK